VVVADNIAAVERAARPDALVVTVQTIHLVDDDILRRLAAVPGDRLVVEPVSRTREALAPAVRRATEGSFCVRPPMQEMCNSTGATPSRQPVRCR
jgi:hypothetical protein